jgi:putative heme transporter
MRHHRAHSSDGGLRRRDRLERLSFRSRQVLLVVALSAVIVWALAQVQLVVIPALIALILTAAMGPAANWMTAHGLPSALATWLTFLAGVVVLGGIATLIALAVQSQWGALTSSVNEGLDRLQEFVWTGPLPIDRDQIASIHQSVIDFLTSRQFGSGLTAGLSIAVQVFTSAVLAIVMLFFFLKDGGQIWAFLLRPFTGEQRERGVRIGRASLGALGGYVRGTALVALVDAIAIGVGLALLGVPLALPLAGVVFLTAFIPLIGATLGGAAAALVALVANGPVTALLVVVLVFLVNQLEGNLLQPLVMGEAVSLHPLVIIVVLTGGTALAGLPGAVLAVPITAAAWAIAKSWNPPDDRVLEGPDGGVHRGHH